MSCFCAGDGLCRRKQLCGPRHPDPAARGELLCQADTGHRGCVLVGPKAGRFGAITTVLGGPAIPGVSFAVIAPAAAAANDIFVMGSLVNTSNYPTALS